jgi:hypothetical protein
MDRTPVASSNLASVGYDRELQVLEIEFLNGSVYQYFNVTEDVWEQLMASSSKGSFLNQQIKPFYAYQRVG